MTCKCRVCKHYMTLRWVGLTGKLRVEIVLLSYIDLEIGIRTTRLSVLARLEPVKEALSCMSASSMCSSFFVSRHYSAHDRDLTLPKCGIGHMRE